MIFVVIVLVSAIFYLFYTGELLTEDYKESENITLETRDGWQIGATWYEGGQEGVVLLHMENSHRFYENPHDETKKIVSLAERLQESGYSVVTIDLRGHGESTIKNNETEEITLEEFDDTRSNDPEENDFVKMKYDVEAAADYLKERSEIEKLGIIGAELGANVALSYTNIGSPDALVLLSPSHQTLTLYWGGIRIVGENRNYENPILYMASEYRSDDLHSRSYTTINTLYEESPSETKEKIIYDGNVGRGTRMLNETVENDIIYWLNEHLE